jgi:hypothetical protein
MRLGTPPTTALWSRSVTHARVVDTRLAAEPDCVPAPDGKIVSMKGRAAGWMWTKVSPLHGGGVCDGQTRSYAYRHYAPSDSNYERCIALAWCSTCREYSGAMVYVPRGEHLTDALANLPTHERERLARSEVKLLDYLDRLARHGALPSSRR